MRVLVTDQADKRIVLVEALAAGATQARQGRELPCGLLDSISQLGAQPRTLRPQSVSGHRSQRQPLLGSSDSLELPHS